MVSEIYKAFVEAGVNKKTARTAAEEIPAIKQDLAQQETRMVKTGIILVVFVGMLAALLTRLL